MTKWEYACITIDRARHDNDVAEKKLDQAGSEGWELVSVVGFLTAVNYYFKRPVTTPRKKASS